MRLKLLEQSVFGGVDMDGDGEITAGEEDLPISITVNTYAECSVSASSSDGGRGCNAFGRIGSVTESETDLDFDGVNKPIVNLGVVSKHLTIKEGIVVSEELWEVTRSDYSFDGFGNEVYAESFGADSLSGDEVYAFTSYIPVGDGTNGRWLPGLISETYIAGTRLEEITNLKTYFAFSTRLLHSPSPFAFEQGRWIFVLACPRSMRVTSGFSPSLAHLNPNTGSRAIAGSDRRRLVIETKHQFRIFDPSTRFNGVPAKECSSLSVQGKERGQTRLIDQPKLNNINHYRWITKRGTSPGRRFLTGCG